MDEVLQGKVRCSMLAPSMLAVGDPRYPTQQLPARQSQLGVDIAGFGPFVTGAGAEPRKPSQSPTRLL